MFPRWTSEGKTRRGYLKVWATLSLYMSEQETMRIKLGVQANISEQVNPQAKSETKDGLCNGPCS